MSVAVTARQPCVLNLAYYAPRTHHFEDHPAHIWIARVPIQRDKLAVHWKVEFRQRLDAARLDLVRIAPFRLAYTLAARVHQLARAPSYSTST
ncbi:hypothetical protein [Burkholderia sp. NFACC33-1]|uniref:hypothetical protein n=1 Tax=Burkholderia sp. NFACC33-1 TaxID=1566269 RepID=UPI00092FE3DA|nr:hypothetical protein [Burkholderia sp. NFACC33-1]